MPKPIRIADVLCYIRGHILAVDESGTLHTWRPDGMPLGTDSQKIAALRRAICGYQTEIPWRTCSMALDRATIEEHVLETRALLRCHRENRFGQAARD